MVNQVNNLLYLQYFQVNKSAKNQWFWSKFKIIIYKKNITNLSIQGEAENRTIKYLSGMP